MTTIEQVISFTSGQDTIRLATSIRLDFVIGLAELQWFEQG